MGEGGRRWGEAFSLAQITFTVMCALSEEGFLIPASSGETFRETCTNAMVGRLSTLQGTPMDILTVWTHPYCLTAC